MSLPSPFDAWYASIVGEPPPDEPLATCDACPMCASRNFRPAVKCCTYIPAMSNFQAGRALASGGDSADAVRERMTQTRRRPIGLLPTLAEERSYENERHSFGATTEVKCPFVSDHGTCRVWAYRDVTCATWFCAHQNGPAGHALWKAAADVLGRAEGLLAAALSEEDYVQAGKRAETISWSQIRELPGGEGLADLEEALIEAHARAQSHREL